MDFQVPTDLIRQVQLSLRENAGLSSYEPDGATLPAIRSLREIVAGFDPSPPYLRCKHCQGRLLRGLQSVICVYCGNRQQKDVPPEPIAFKSTLGYQWFLQSLDLDGSETAGPAIEENEPHRGQSTPKDGVLLSDLLNIEIAWPAESEKFEHSLTNNELVQSKSSLNLVGVDLDNFFAESKRDIGRSSEEFPFANKPSSNVEINAFSSQEKLSLFQSVQHSATVVSSAEVEDNDGFSGWEANFQSADSGNQHDASRSFDPFIGSKVDLSAQLDSVFGPRKDIKDNKPEDASTPLASATNEGIGDELWNDSNFLAPPQTEQVDVTIKSNNDVAADNLYCHASTSIDWFPDDEWRTSSTTPPDKKTVTEDDDSFDVLNDFTSSIRAQDPFKNSSTLDYQTAGVDKQSSDIEFHSSTNDFQEMDFGSFSQPGLICESFSNQNDSSVEVSAVKSEVPALDRLADVEIEVGGGGQGTKDGDIVNSAQLDQDVESLLSQMHDLSFMLKNDLSVPSKQVD